MPPTEASLGGILVIMFYSLIIIGMLIYFFIV